MMGLLDGWVVWEGYVRGEMATVAWSRWKGRGTACDFVSE